MGQRLWAKKKKKSTQRLISDEDKLNYICLRANYLAYCQKNFQLSCHFSPVGNVWGIMDGKFLPMRNILRALPASFSFHISQNYEDNSESDDIDHCSGTESENYG